MCWLGGRSLAGFGSAEPAGIEIDSLADGVVAYGTAHQQPTLTTDGACLLLTHTNLSPQAKATKLAQDTKVRSEYD